MQPEVSCIFILLISSSLLGNKPYHYSDNHFRQNSLIVEFCDICYTIYYILFKDFVLYSFNNENIAITSLVNFQTYSKSKNYVSTVNLNFLVAEALDHSRDCHK